MTLSLEYSYYKLQFVTGVFLLHLNLIILLRVITLVVQSISGPGKLVDLELQPKQWSQQGHKDSTPTPVKF